VSKHICATCGKRGHILYQCFLDKSEKTKMIYRCVNGHEWPRVLKPKVSGFKKMFEEIESLKSKNAFLLEHSQKLSQCVENQAETLLHKNEEIRQLAEILQQAARETYPPNPKPEYCIFCFKYHYLGEPCNGFA
jgi:hypothetical protein